ncbi:protease FtsH subunit HflC [Halanaerobium saccharolyticum]|uniref:Protein HflC n=1 Tax=Halanaerobium saccharolyticum TaxID=43595 RepID=A0A4R7YRA3_9FIRM|nr:protease modulator HflC [Halanaerobium saccharolyticum]RAK03994.1 protease FtsH subunit HflC [Halanaerobium saccharolyticum]TDV97333.1 protease FtsH subunit HflC [Halanaerobium saccharolyticum]TDX49100.1 protease FtsH subunit HflC [Halanaerobium saccharolyticum]
MKKLLTFLLLILVIVLAYNFFTFTVDETKTAVVKQFGEVVKISKEPGLHFKMPFVQNVIYLEDRILSYDIEPRKLITSDKKHLLVNNYALWKIDDPLKFVQTMSGQRTLAQTRIDDIVYSNLRNKLASETFDNIVSEKRIGYLNSITEESRKQLKDYGIHLIDVKIKRADLPEANEEVVYERMSSERKQRAKQIRAQGQRESEIIKAEADKEAEIIGAQAEKKAQELRGQGDAKALQVYSNVYSQDTEFYKFWRSLQSYKNSLKEKTTIILSEDMEYLKYLNPAN